MCLPQNLVWILFYTASETEYPCVADTYCHVCGDTLRLTCAYAISATSCWSMNCFALPHAPISGYIAPTRNGQSTNKTSSGNFDITRWPLSRMLTCEQVRCSLPHVQPSYSARTNLQKPRSPLVMVEQMLAVNFEYTKSKFLTSESCLRLSRPPGSMCSVLHGILSQNDFYA